MKSALILKPDLTELLQNRIFAGRILRSFMKGDEWQTLRFESYLGWLSRLTPKWEGISWNSFDRFNVE